MKHLVIGLVILALLLAASIGAVSLLENRAGQIVQELRLAEQALDQDAPALASDYARKAMDLWQRYSGFLGSILYHAEMDDINVHFAPTRRKRRRPGSGRAEIDLRRAYRPGRASAPDGKGLLFQYLRPLLLARHTGKSAEKAKQAGFFRALFFVCRAHYGHRSRIPV